MLVSSSIVLHFVLQCSWVFSFTSLKVPFFHYIHVHVNVYLVHDPFKHVRSMYFHLAMILLEKFHAIKPLLKIELELLMTLHP